MIKNKAIILTPLLFAWTIIFAHSIIPHNHHHESVEECKTHTDNSNDNHRTDFVSFFSSHDHHSEDNNHCHFNINTTLTKYVDSPNAFFYSEIVIVPVSSLVQTICCDHQVSLLKHFYFDSFTHRGPPSFS